MQDNKQQLIEDTERRLKFALEQYYTYVGKDIAMAESARMEFTQLQADLAELTGVEVYHV